MKPILIILFMLLPFGVLAQPPVKSFTLTEAINGTAVSLDSFAESAGVVVLFTSNECPYDTYYADRIASLIRQYSSKIPFLLINAHLEPEESVEKMKSKASSWSFNSMPYLIDKDQIAMEALGAKRSPEVFLLKHVKGNFVQLYSGAIDDNPQEPAAVTKHHLKEEIDKLLAGKIGTHHQVRAVGCSIRKK